MNRNFAWQRVSRRRLCPVCGKPDWCMYVGPHDSPDAVICARIESPKRCGEAGWLHVLHDDGPTWAPWRRTLHRIVATAAASIDAKRIDFNRLAADFRAAVRPEALGRLAAALGVSAASLRRLGIGWAARHRAWSFPMRDAGGNVLGIRLRRADGRKLAVRGGHEGLFMPEGYFRGNSAAGLLVAEGPTDTAALLDLGFSAVGRPSCSGGVKLLTELVYRLKPSGVAIVADADAPGQRGAENLAAVLVAYCPEVRVIAPPAAAKDIRQWKRLGATAADVQAAIDAAAVRKLEVSIRIRGRKGR